MRWTCCPNFHALEVENGVSPMNFVKMLGHSSREEFIKTHDWALIVVNVKGYAQENDVRVRWSCNHSLELPWYNEEIPTVAISLNYTNHLMTCPRFTPSSMPTAPSATTSGPPSRRSPARANSAAPPRTTCSVTAGTPACKEEPL